MKAHRWFVVETGLDGSWMDFAVYETLNDAAFAAERFWEYACSPKDRKHRRIEVALLWAVYDEGEENWFPMMETDEGFDRDLAEGNWIGSYTPSFTIGPDDR